MYVILVEDTFGMKGFDIVEDSEFEEKIKGLRVHKFRALKVEKEVKEWKK